MNAKFLDFADKKKLNLDQKTPQIFRNFKAAEKLHKISLATMVFLCLKMLHYDVNKGK